MQTVLIVVHLLVVIALIGVVLLQRSEGGLGLGSGGSGGVGGFLTGRGQANALTRATAGLAAAFFALSLLQAWIAHRGTAPRSIFDTAAPASATPGQAPAQGNDDFLQKLQRMQDAPVPTTPGTPQVPQSR